MKKWNGGVKMKKQELIDDIEKNKNEFYKLSTDMKSTGISKCIATGTYTGLSISQKKIEQLDEQPKVTVPKFVADWIKQCKENATLADCLKGYYEISDGEGAGSEDFQNWVVDNENDELTAKAWMFGYEVEKEQLYQVKIPTVNWDEYSSELVTEYAYLIWDITSDEYKLSASNKDYKSWRASLTESEIKSIDERYWAFAVPVEEDK